MKYPKQYSVIVTASDLQRLEQAFKLAGHRLLYSVASRHDGNYSIWGTSHVMARVMFDMVELGIPNLATVPVLS